MGKRYTEEVVKTIRILRKSEKLSFREIGRRFNISSNTIGIWCRGTVGNRWDSLLISNQKKRDSFLSMDLGVVPKPQSVSNQKALLFASLLYGCEGSKYPAHVGVSFANSDPKLMLCFLGLLRTAFVLDENKFSIHLQIHTTQDYAQLRTYWSNLLNISDDHFIKPTVTEPKQGKHRDDYRGTCTLRYRDYSVQLRLLGVFERFLSIFKAE